MRIPLHLNSNDKSHAAAIARVDLAIAMNAANPAGFRTARSSRKRKFARGPVLPNTLVEARAAEAYGL